jgi:polyisoprenoid-binding protein YceI
VVVPAESQVDVEVGRGGLFKFAGHEHVIRIPVHGGDVTAVPGDLGASSVRLTFKTGESRVLSSGGPADDIPRIEEKMRGPAVLDAAAFPEASFVSRRVTGAYAETGATDLVVEGELRLRSVAWPLKVPVTVERKDGRLLASAKLSLRQTDLGIQPVSVAGVVKVKNELQLELRVVARCDPP